MYAKKRGFNLLFSEEDVKEYLQQVIREVKSKRPLPTRPSMAIHRLQKDDRAKISN
jgi:hypothetical protein